MNAEIFAEWLRRQGHTVARTETSYWYNAGPRVFQAFPFHWLIRPTEEELNDFLRREHALGLRYSTSIESRQGCVSYHAVYNQQAYSLEGLDRRSRQNIRSGLRNCQVQEISIDRLAEEGWLLEKDTANRQNRDVQITKDSWRRKYIAAADLSGFEAWGALVGDRLVASILAFQMGDTVELISQQCDRDFLKAKVNNALAYSVTRNMINRPGISSLFYTLQSLDADASVDEFKFRLGYTPVPVRQRVVFHPWISPLVNRASHAGLKWLRKRCQGDTLIRKAEGMARFYLSGKSSAREQDWPECLSGAKEKVLSNSNWQVSHLE
jgi:hypothetical protein